MHLTGLAVYKEGHRYMYQQKHDHKQIKGSLVKCYCSHLCPAFKPINGFLRKVPLSDAFSTAHETPQDR